MFEKSRRKIVLLIMSVLVVLFLGMLGIIYGTSYYEVSQRNQEMLERYVELYSLEEQPQIEKLPVKVSHSENTKAFRLSTFYSVALSEEGEVLGADNEKTAVYSTKELAEIAAEIRKKGRTYGTRGNLVYRKAEKEGYTLVAFMDNTVMQESMTTLFRYTLVFGSIAVVLFFFLSVYLAKRIVAPLEESYGKQKQFISDAGHELKTPVSVISANAELLLREIGENKWLSNIQYENERMGELTTQLLELARAENAEQEMEKLDLGRLVTGEMLPFECMAFEQGITLSSRIEEGVCVSGSSLQMKQLVSILLDNAIRHCGEGKEVTVLLKREKGEGVLRIINSGEEIPREQRGQLFERFYRVDTARSGEECHYGLGLAIAKAILESHRGKINVLCYDGKVEFAVGIPLWKG